MVKKFRWKQDAFSNKRLYPTTPPSLSHTDGLYRREFSTSEQEFEFDSQYPPGVEEQVIMNMGFFEIFEEEDKKAARRSVASAPESSPIVGEVTVTATGEPPKKRSGG